MKHRSFGRLAALFGFFILFLLVGCGFSFAVGTGLTGEYFDNSDFTSLKLTRVDPAVDFDWGSGPPAPGVSSGSYSVRWSGQIEPRYSETYTFQVTADDSARLWVN